MSDAVGAHSPDMTAWQDGFGACGVIQNHSPALGDHGVGGNLAWILQKDILVPVDPWVGTKGSVIVVPTELHWATTLVGLTWNARVLRIE